MVKRPRFKSCIEYYHWYLDWCLEFNKNRVSEEEYGRISRRVNKMRKRVGIRFIEDADRLWLMPHAIGKGFDIACGDFPIGDGIGIDKDWTVLGATYTMDGSDLSTIPNSTEQDFIVSNYLDAFSAPLTTLEEWYRCIRKGGKLALVVRDSTGYTDYLEGPLFHKQRRSIFTKETLAMYLYKAGFDTVTVEENKTNASLRGLAIK